MPLDQQTGYLEQGYANVAAAPLDMQLRQVQESRLRLSGAQRRDRAGARLEQKQFESDQQVDDYLGFNARLMEGDLNTLEKQEARRKGFEDNPLWDLNVEISSMQTGSDKRHDRQRGRKKEALQDKQDVLTEKRVDAGLESFDERNKLVEDQMTHQRQVLTKQMDKARELELRTENDNTAQLSAGLLSSVSSLANSADRKLVVAAHDKLDRSDQPSHRDAAVAIRRVGTAIGLNSTLSKMGKAQIGRNDPFLNKLKALNIKTSGLYDPATVDETMQFISNTVSKMPGFDEEDMQSLETLAKSVSNFSSISKDAGILEKTFLDTLPSIQKNLMSADPELRDEAEQNLAYLTALSNDQLAFATAGANTIMESEALLDKQQAEEQRLLDIRKDVASINSSESRAGIARQKMEYRRQIDAIDNRKAALKLAIGLKQDSQEDILGLDSDSTYEQIADAILSYQGEVSDVGGEDDI